MKKFAAFVMILSLAALTVGCTPAADKGKGGKGTTAGTSTTGGTTAGSTTGGTTAAPAK
jgi:hypothetical protein